MLFFYIKTIGFVLYCQVEDNGSCEGVWSPGYWMLYTKGSDVIFLYCNLDSISFYCLLCVLYIPYCKNVECFYTFVHIIIPVTWFYLMFFYICFKCRFSRGFIFYLLLYIFYLLINNCSLSFFHIYSQMRNCEWLVIVIEMSVCNDNSWKTKHSLETTIKCIKWL